LVSIIQALTLPILFSYKQALEVARLGKEKVIAAGVTFTRPDDYFAEMVKSDEHMAKARTLFCIPFVAEFRFMAH